MRLAFLTLLGVLSALVTFALLYIETGENEVLVRLGMFWGYSVFLGILLFVALTFFFRRQSIASVLIFATLATILLPSAAAFAALLPTYGVAGSLECLPSLSSASGVLLVFELAQSLVFALVAYLVVDGITGA